MILAKVLGNAVATVKHELLTGHKVLVVQPVNRELAPAKPSFLAIDSVQAGPGDLVLVEREGNAARQILEDSKGPFHSVIVGIVDSIVFAA